MFWFLNVSLFSTSNFTHRITHQDQALLKLFISSNRFHFLTMKDIKPIFLAAFAIFCSQKGVQALPQGIGVQPLPDDNYCDPDPPYQVRNVVEDEKPTEPIRSR